MKESKSGITCQSLLQGTAAIAATQGLKIPGSLPLPLLTNGSGAVAAVAPVGFVSLEFWHRNFFDAIKDLKEYGVNKDGAAFAAKLRQALEDSIFMTIKGCRRLWDLRPLILSGEPKRDAEIRKIAMQISADRKRFILTELAHLAACYSPVNDDASEHHKELDEAIQERIPLSDAKIDMLRQKSLGELESILTFTNSASEKINGLPPHYHSEAVGRAESFEADIRHAAQTIDIDPQSLNLLTSGHSSLACFIDNMGFNYTPLIDLLLDQELFFKLILQLENTYTVGLMAARFSFEENERQHRPQELKFEGHIGGPLVVELFTENLKKFFPEIDPKHFAFADGKTRAAELTTSWAAHEDRNRQNPAANAIRDSDELLDAAEKVAGHLVKPVLPSSPATKQDATSAAEALQITYNPGVTLTDAPARQPESVPVNAPPLNNSRPA